MSVPRILIAEDEIALRDLYAAVLSQAGYQVIAVTDGLEAYEQLTVGTFDLFLLDILMPKLNGIDLLQRLKTEDKLGRAARIVMLTNLSDDMKIAQALQYGIRGYMVKSNHTPDTLLKEIKKYLES